ncbi:hypothetical protein JCM17843_06410 [Kordiimonadales bacterium JCM 17843]|nr:hypothetical protein JCM17843_06410 [Kordiimonadales bacterium JCM 17843]
MGNGLARALSVGAIICLSALGFSSGIAVAQTLVVGNKTADTLGFIDISSGEMRAVRATGHGPHEVAISLTGRWLLSSLMDRLNRKAILSACSMCKAPRL